MSASPARCLAVVATALALAACPPSPAQQCPGDCNGDELVAIDELITAVNIALGRVSIARCAPADRSFDGGVDIAELISAVGGAVAGCDPARFRFVGFEQVADDRPDRVGEGFIEVDICRNDCVGGDAERFSALLLGVLVEARAPASGLLESVEVRYPTLDIAPLLNRLRQPISASYCVERAGVPCETDGDCGAGDTCVAAPTCIAFNGLDLDRKADLAGGQCGGSIEPTESPLMVRVRLVDESESPIELIGATTLIADDFDNCAFR